MRWVAVEWDQIRSGSCGFHLANKSIKLFTEDGKGTAINIKKKIITGIANKAGRECVDMAIPRQPAGTRKGEQPRMQPVPGMKQVIRYFFQRFHSWLSISVFYLICCWRSRSENLIKLRPVDFVTLIPRPGPGPAFDTFLCPYELGHRQTPGASSLSTSVWVCVFCFLWVLDFSANKQFDLNGQIRLRIAWESLRVFLSRWENKRSNCRAVSCLTLRPQHGVVLQPDDVILLSSTCPAKYLLLRFPYCFQHCSEILLLLRGLHNVNVSDYVKLFSYWTKLTLKYSVGQGQEGTWVFLEVSQRTLCNLRNSILKFVLIAGEIMAR